MAALRFNTYILVVLFRIILLYQLFGLGHFFSLDESFLAYPTTTLRFRLYGVCPMLFHFFIIDIFPHTFGGLSFLGSLVDMQRSYTWF